MRSRFLLPVLVAGLTLSTGCFRGPRAMPAPELMVVHEGPIPQDAPVKQDRVKVEVAKQAPAKEDAPAGPYEFPKDGGGKELAKSLPAGVGLQLPPDAPSAPRSHTPPTSVVSPSLPLSLPPTGSALLPSRPAPPSTRPGKVQEEPPFISYLGNPTLPASEPLSTGVAVRVPSPEVKEPIAPPVLGALTPDRAPLDDPTSEASREAALAAAPPARTSPAPFQKNNLPDPYENRVVGRVRTPPVEDPVPTAASPRLPKP